LEADGKEEEEWMEQLENNILQREEDDMETVLEN
jgi:hypothetical protein